MSQIYIPEGYKSSLGIKETEKAIKRVKDFFQRELITQLNLSRVSAPLFGALLAVQNIILCDFIRFRYSNQMRGQFQKYIFIAFANQRNC